MHRKVQVCTGKYRKVQVRLMQVSRQEQRSTGKYRAAGERTNRSQPSLMLAATSLPTAVPTPHSFLLASLCPSFTPLLPRIAPHANRNAHTHPRTTTLSTRILSIRKLVPKAPATSSRLPSLPCMARAYRCCYRFNSFHNVCSLTCCSFTC